MKQEDKRRVSIAVVIVATVAGAFFLFGCTASLDPSDQAALDAIRIEQEAAQAELDETKAALASLLATDQSGLTDEERAALVAQVQAEVAKAKALEAELAAANQEAEGVLAGAEKKTAAPWLALVDNIAPGASDLASTWWPLLAFAFPRPRKNAKAAAKKIAKGDLGGAVSSLGAIVGLAHTSEDSKAAAQSA